VDQVECILAARDVLAALKVIHVEGMLHLNINPSNIFRCKTVSIKQGGEKSSKEFAYKLLGFGTVQHADDTATKAAVANITGTQSVGLGTLTFHPPEMFRESANTTYSADLWSLGATMFELLTCTLPFQGTGHSVQTDAAGNSEEKASLLNRINHGMGSKFDHSLVSVISTALENKAKKRYQSADEMHGAVFGCLVVRGSACYSAYLSYRAESDAPLAKLLFDELHHSVTPGGHRVAMYLDAHGGHAQGVNWDQDIADGLLHSTCYFPILSYGATAPLASCAEGTSPNIAMGWEEAPLGLTRLDGAEHDREDALLKEMLIAGALLERSSESVTPVLLAEGRLGSQMCLGSVSLLAEELGRLCSVYPVFAGRQHPLGHPDYPRMGSYLDVQSGCWRFPVLPSPSSNRAAANFLRDRAGLSVDAVRQVEGRSVASIVSSLAQVQGCSLWNHMGDLAEAKLTKEQQGLVGKGYGGPPVTLDDIFLSAEQVDHCPPAQNS
jgi:hypothetical protein